MLRVFLKSGQVILKRSQFGFRQKNYFSKKNTESSSLWNMRRKIRTIKESALTWSKDYSGEDTFKWGGISNDIPKHCDIVVIGGGAMGSSVAFWLKQRVFKDMKVVVVEKDPTYSSASTVLSVGGLRQQFSLSENIEMSLFGAEFLRNINDHLGIEDEPPIDPGFHPYGYLVLASEAGAETLATNSKLQISLGAKNVLLTATMLRKMFPWLNTDGIAVGCLGLEKEGWFDPWTLLCALKRKAVNLGAKYIHAEAKGFEYKSPDITTEDALDSLIIQTPDGETKKITFAIAVIAAGPFSAQVARMAKIGVANDLRETPLPVEPRKRYVYCFHCPDGPGLNTPLTVDTSGTYFRRDGLAGNFICGRSPGPEDEPPIGDLSVDHDYFNEKVWPALAERVKDFENLKVKSSWAGYYEYNTYDKNGIIGAHPFYDNLYFATGFSGHGIQQSPAVGRAIAELILDSRFMTINLERLGFERFINSEPMLEVNIV